MKKYIDGQFVDMTPEEISALEAMQQDLPEPEPTPEERIETLEKENHLLKTQISTQSEQMQFYEDCISEMAEIVYA